MQAIFDTLPQPLKLTAYSRLGPLAGSYEVDFPKYFGNGLFRIRLLAF